MTALVSLAAFQRADGDDPVTASEMFRTPFIQATIFLALFMLTDPPTAPARYAEQVAIGLLVAVASVAAEELGAGQSYLLIGVLSGNVALAVRRWLAQRGPVSSVARRQPSGRLTECDLQKQTSASARSFSYS